MKSNNPDIEKFRYTGPGIFSSDKSLGNNGYFVIKYKKVILKVVVSDQLGWDHVSVSPAIKKRTPTWGEMCCIKDLFFEPEETVIQFHPPKSQYINNHPYCLHLWRNHSQEIILPPKMMIG
jgi:hypothetical protein